MCTRGRPADLRSALHVVLRLAGVHAMDTATPGPGRRRCHTNKTKPNATLVQRAVLRAARPVLLAVQYARVERVSEHVLA